MKLVCFRLRIGYLDSGSKAMKAVGKAFKRAAERHSKGLPFQPFSWGLETCSFPHFLGPQKHDTLNKVFPSMARN